MTLRISNIWLQISALEQDKCGALLRWPPLEDALTAPLTREALPRERSGRCVHSPPPGKTSLCRRYPDHARPAEANTAAAFPKGPGQARPARRTAAVPQA